MKRAQVEMELEPSHLDKVEDGANYAPNAKTPMPETEDSKMKICTSAKAIEISSRLVMSGFRDYYVMFCICLCSTDKLI